jgi:hypothetical protein
MDFDLDILISGVEQCCPAALRDASNISATCEQIVPGMSSQSKSAEGFTDDRPPVIPRLSRGRGPASWSSLSGRIPPASKSIFVGGSNEPLPFWNTSKHEPRAGKVRVTVSCLPRVQHALRLNSESVLGINEINKEQSQIIDRVSAIELALFKRPTSLHNKMSTGDEERKRDGRKSVPKLARTYSPGSHLASSQQTRRTERRKSTKMSCPGQEAKPKENTTDIFIHEVISNSSSAKEDSVNNGSIMALLSSLQDDVRLVVKRSIEGEGERSSREKETGLLSDQLINERGRCFDQILIISKLRSQVSGLEDDLAKSNAQAVALRSKMLNIYESQSAIRCTSKPEKMQNFQPATRCVNDYVDVTVPAISSISRERGSLPASCAFRSTPGLSLSPQLAARPSFEASSDGYYEEFDNIDRLDCDAHCGEMCGRALDRSTTGPGDSGGLSTTLRMVLSPRTSYKKTSQALRTMIQNSRLSGSLSPDGARRKGMFGKTARKMSDDIRARAARNSFPLNTFETTSSRYQHSHVGDDEKGTRRRCLSLQLSELVDNIKDDDDQAQSRSGAAAVAISRPASFSIQAPRLGESALYEDTESDRSAGLAVERGSFRSGQCIDVGLADDDDQKHETTPFTYTNWSLRDTGLWRKC